MEKAVVFEVYLYIGITSLCLYHNAGRVIFQDGIFHKIPDSSSCKWEKSPCTARNSLTPGDSLWYALSVGADFPYPFSFCQKQLKTGKESAKMLQTDFCGSR